MAANNLIFKDAEKARDAILESQKKEIANLYNDWANEIGDRANYYKNKTTSSSWVSEVQMRELQKQLRATSKEVSNEVYKTIKQNMYMVSDAVVQCNAQWLAQFGFEDKGINAAFSSVNDSVIRNIVTGQIYDSGWSLSKRIWGDNEQTLKDIYQVVAKGMAENMPMYDIAKNLEMYVRPDAKLPWNLKAKDGARIYKKQVDYNAQRLGRTLVQHGYQQSFIATTQKNPFITDYIWCSNGSRVCPLCADRDGQHYDKDNLPMDHPNGMCTMIPNVADNLDQQLVDWFNSEDGTYPEIDEFAKNFGYTPSKIKTEPKNEKLNDMYNKFFANGKYTKTNMPDFYSWYSELGNKEQKDFITYSGISTNGKKSYQIKAELDDFYKSVVGNKNITKEVSQVVSKVEKATTKIAKNVVKENVTKLKTNADKMISNVNIEGIRSKNLVNTIEDAFNSIKSESRLKVDVDKVIKNIKYAQGNMSATMVKQNAGAMVQGNTVWIERSTQKYLDKDFITHEIGHKVTIYGDRMTDATARRVAEELVKELGYKDIKSMSSYVSDYATKNPTELFPEAFMEYFSGKELRGNKKKIVEAVMNKMYFK